MNLATLMTIEGDYLQTLGVPLLCGRFFAQAESSSWGVIQRIWPAIFDLLRLGRFADTDLHWGHQSPVGPQGVITVTSAFSLGVTLTFCALVSVLGITASAS